MRHSDINLTMRHYTHPYASDRVKAVNSFPPIKVPSDTSEAAARKSG